MSNPLLLTSHTALKACILHFIKFKMAREPFRGIQREHLLFCGAGSLSADTSSRASSPAAPPTSVRLTSSHSKSASVNGRCRKSYGMYTDDDQSDETPLRWYRDKYNTDECKALLRAAVHLYSRVRDKPDYRALNRLPRWSSLNLGEELVNSRLHAMLSTSGRLDRAGSRAVLNRRRFCGGFDIGVPIAGSAEKRGMVPCRTF